MDSRRRDAAGRETGTVPMPAAFSAREEELLEAWGGVSLGPDFPRRAVDRFQSTRRQSRAVRVGAAIAAVLALVLSVGLSSAGRLGLPSQGEVTAAVRTSVALGRRAVAVLEPGAHLRWQVDALGRAVVEQPQGSAFYRVQSGGAFVVNTPAGQVSVTGTCFRVEVLAMKSSQAGVVGTVSGALVASAVWLTVYEGSVTAASQGTQRQVLPGEQFELASNSLKAAGAGRVPSPAYARAPGALGPTSLALPHASQNAMTGTAGELEEMRGRVRELEEKLAMEQAYAEEKQGVPQKPPASLDKRFDADVLRSSINAGLRELGLEGEVTDVDCSEYPCMIVGELKESHFDREQSQRLGKTGALSAYGKDQKFSFGSTSRGDGGQERHLFGVAVFPASADEAERQQLAKRLHYRWGELSGTD